MASRIELHNILVEILGTRNVYFQPPSSVLMKYPAIVYSRSDIKNISADNIQYLNEYEYQVTIIDTDPDSEIVEKLARLPYCRFSRHYTSDNLNHDVFKIIF